MRVLYIAPCWEYHPVLVDTLQTNREDNWQVIVAHDGEPSGEWLRSFYSRYEEDSRVKLVYSVNRMQEWGHPLRDMVVQFLRGEAVPALMFPRWTHPGVHDLKEYHAVCHTNCDNFVTPNHAQAVLSALFHQPTATAVYHPAIHNYFGWTYFPGGLCFGQIDCCQFTARKEYALEVGWRERVHHADWIYMQDIINKWGEDRVFRVPGDPVLAVHN